MELAAQLVEVTFSHDGRRRALDDATLAVPRGGATALVGANGSGKSTALGVLAGVLTPRTGLVRTWTGSRPSLVVQRSDVDDRLPVTVRDTVAMGRWARLGWLRRPRQADRDVVERCLDAMGLHGVADERLGDLSGGQRQRALVAQGLAQEADLMLLDEPTTGLDRESLRHVVDVVRSAGVRGTTVVVATHDLALARGCDHAVLLDAGSVVGEGRPDEVLAASDRSWAG
ncbi:MAG: zinc ABC transporter ATP-binding protein AztA [Nocardioidaceae bacterium]|nr:zinc ABC transporter ATP-binding protein AztA [Nocardioidaceae bacterium]